MGRLAATIPIRPCATGYYGGGVYRGGSPIEVAFTAEEAFTVEEVSTGVAAE